MLVCSCGVDVGLMLLLLFCLWCAAVIVVPVLLFSIAFVVVSRHCLYFVVGASLSLLLCC